MVNLVTLNVEHTSSPSSVRLREAALACGHSMELVAASDLTLVVEPAGLALFFKGTRLPRFHGVIPRLSAASDPFGLAVLKHLEATGCVAINVSESIRASHDKLHTAQRLRQLNLPVPPSIAVRRASDIRGALHLLGGSQYIVKTVHGSQGVGVMLAESPTSASAIAETMLANRLPVIIQRYFPEARSSDIRTFIVGDRVIAAMRRHGRFGEFRSNLHRGGTAERLKLDPALEELALRATRAMGLSIAGVDIIETDLGPLILEVNSSPGLSGIEATTGIDVATPIITQLEQLITSAAQS